jgi:hypothetical protein
MLNTNGVANATHSQRKCRGWFQQLLQPDSAIVTLFAVVATLLGKKCANVRLAG